MAKEENFFHKSGSGGVCGSVSNIPIGQLIERITNKGIITFLLPLMQPPDINIFFLLFFHLRKVI
jgi:hypothetical protein